MRISRKGIARNVKFSRVELPASNRGRNKRGVCAHKMTRGAKAAKAQIQTGYEPRPVTAYRMRLDRV